MRGLRLLKVWTAATTAVSVAWRERRTEAGGVADEAAMIAILLGAAVAIAGIVAALVSGAAAQLPDIIVPG
jgi:hypothetical protein